ncbi:hypothetical protein [Agromyces humatus]|uniref:Ankyrin repeat domain-containing protein n=1 Tax=Agromyces humatus TaxID=279573 RepID=A0ABP4X305_9MICO|nr:hypothetical protein [Agromyces humatus]
MDIVFEAQRRTLDGFLEIYESNLANAEVNGRSVLLAALTNVNPDARAGIATLLLDDGADARVTAADGVNALHALLGNAELDPVREAPVVERLIGAGADVNAVAKKFGTPLQVLMSQFRYTDEALAPFYDVLFSSEALDLLRVGAYDRSAYTMAVKSTRRGALRARMEQYLRDRGVEIPQEA